MGGCRGMVVGTTNDMAAHEGHSARVRHYERATLLFKRAVLLLILTALKIADVDMPSAHSGFQFGTVAR